MTALERQGAVWVLHLGDDDNRFDGDTVGEIAACLDEVAAGEGPAALVTTAGGKIWSNGLDLEHLGTLEDWQGFVGSVEALFSRLLRLPVPTVAAIGGHAFAAGAMLALAHDLRVMRTDRGYLCLPEVDLGIPFSEGMAALIAAKLMPPTRHRMAVLGERFTGPEALAAGAVDAVADEGEVRAEAIRRAEGLAPKAGPTLPAIRAGFYGDALRALGSADA